MSYSKLFERGRIGNLRLKNRIVMPAMGTGFAKSNGEASDEIIRYYEERAKGGCGLIITEITRIDDETGVGMACQLAATKGRHIQGLERLADAVHRYDTRIFAQLHHPGRQTPSKLLDGKQIVAPSPIPCKVVGEMPRELTTAECEAMGKKFIAGAFIAKTAGFDGVEIHAAHGYLINQFISPYTNKRTDKYGGSFTNRMRLLTEIIIGIRYALPGFPISVRISADEFIEGGLKLEDTVKIARYLESIGVACINVSCGTYESGYSIIEPYTLPEAWKKHLATAIKKAVKIPVIAVNNIKHPAVAEQLLEEGVCDFVGIGRGQLVDPEWANKAKYGNEKLLRKCIGCMYCFKIENEGRALQCTVNPRLGRETVYGDDKLQKDGAGRTVAVIGGGPGGMQAALVLAKRGFKPVLFEKGPCLGGTMRIAGMPPHKELIGELVETMKNELAEWKVDVRLNTEATVDAVAALEPYGVIVACGGSAIVPKVPGVDGANVYTAEEVITGKVKLTGKKVAVIGGGVTGLETAEVLGDDNDVSVIEMTGAVGTTLYASVKAMLMRSLAAKNVRILCDHTLTGISEGKVHTIVTSTAFEEDFDADAVVLALGVRAGLPLVEQFENAFDHVTAVGDARKPGLIADAMREANDKAFVF